MTDESAEVPGELTGKSGAAAGRRAPLTSAAGPRVPRSRGAPSGRRRAGRGAGNFARVSPPGKPSPGRAAVGSGGGPRSPGAPPQPRPVGVGVEVGGSGAGAGRAGWGVLEARSTPDGHQPTAPNSGKSGKDQHGGRAHGGVTSGTCRAPPPGAPPHPPATRTRGEGALLWGAPRARRGVASPSPAAAKGLQD